LKPRAPLAAADELLPLLVGFRGVTVCEGGGTTIVVKLDDPELVVLAPEVEPEELEVAVEEPLTVPPAVIANWFDCARMLVGWVESWHKLTW